MIWNEEDQKALIGFKDAIDSDNIHLKEHIKKILLNNRFIIHVLDNKDLEASDAEPEDYFGVNILPFYLVPDIQHSVNNYICYEVNYDTLNRYNSCVKTIQVVFRILCRQEETLDYELGIAKHDLLGALIQDQFNYLTLGNIRLQLVSDVATSTDRSYILRTMIFQHSTDNNLVKSKWTPYGDGSMYYVPRLANKDTVFNGQSKP